MLNEQVYTLKELTEILKESTSEFNAKTGKGVNNENKRNNAKGVNDIMKETDKYNKVSSSAQKRKTDPEDIQDYNRTTLDAEFAAEPSKEYKDRVKSQVEGYASVDNKKNSDAKDNGGLDFKGNETFLKSQSQKMKKIADRKQEVNHAGLKSHNLPKENFKKNTLFNEHKTMKRLHFKNTRFLSEAQIFDKVPDEYKIDGNRFIMRDKTGTDYLLECRVDDSLNYTQLKVVNTINRQSVNEELNRMRSLYNYNSEAYSQGTTASTRVNEDRELRKLVSQINENKPTK